MSALPPMFLARLVQLNNLGHTVLWLTRSPLTLSMSLQLRLDKKSNPRLPSSHAVRPKEAYIKIPDQSSDP